MTSAVLDKERTMQSFMGWVGGKRLLAKTIAALLPRHTCYVEVFGGAAWVLFAKEPSKVEVYNDRDGRLVELFRSIKYHAQAFVRELEFVVPSRELFDLFREQRGLTEIQRAARFYYVVKMSFGKRGEHFGYGKDEGGGTGGLVLHRVTARVDEVRQRLEKATVEHDDFERVLERFDGPKTCAFLDPPYIAGETYRVPFTEDDHERLYAAVSRLQGRCLITYDDHEWVRQRYHGATWRIYAVTGKYLLANAAPQAARQLIITNYTPRKSQIAAAPRRLKRIQ